MYCRYLVYWTAVNILFSKHFPKDVILREIRLKFPYELTCYPNELYWIYFRVNIHKIVLRNFMN